MTKIIDSDVLNPEVGRAGGSRVTIDSTVDEADYLDSLLWFDAKPSIED